jgi:ADP-ribosylglycohydrolase
VDTRWLIPVPEDVDTERLQAEQEGRDLAALAQQFERLRAAPHVPPQEFFRLLDAVQAIPSRTEEFEPNDFDCIVEQSDFPSPIPFRFADLDDRIRGAWRGRVAGCLLGKPVECWTRAQIAQMLEETGQGPPLRGFLRRWAPLDRFGPVAPGNESAFLEGAAIIPEDDDLNYTILGLLLLERCGYEFATEDVASEWVARLDPLKTCTAERVAMRNLLSGIRPPRTATYRNPYREWIGAQIRADAYGYASPGDPRQAARMAWTDARLSHVRNGIYGSIFYAAMIAAALVTSSLEEAFEVGIRCVPRESRLAHSLQKVQEEHRKLNASEALEAIHSRWDETRQHDWCHSISNAEVVAWALLHGEGVFDRSVCLAVEAGFDTDCNAATVGSVLGAMLGASGLEGTLAQRVVGLPVKTGVRGAERVEEEDFVRRMLRVMADRQLA